MTHSSVAVVTGAAGVLGRAVAKVLAGNGWQVIGIDLAEAEDRADLMLYLPGIDLRSLESTAAAFARIKHHAQSLDALVNVAGGFVWERIGQGGIAVWDRMYDMNLRTALNSCVSALPLMSRGAIVNVGAMASLKAEEGMGAYSASKAALARLTESLAAETRTRGIRVNAVLPSIIDTAANRTAMPNARFDEWVKPEALAEVIAFLLSTGARAITGALLPVTGAGQEPKGA